MRTFFDRELDTAATFWRVFRRDGVALGFVSHDRDLAFGGLIHRSAPGMAPFAIRMTSDLSEDSAGVDGALSHATISAHDLSAGLFDDAAVEIGIVDWETGEHGVLYSGTLGQIEDDGYGFSGELRSAKSILDKDFVPRTSPTCRASFCGRGCGLSASMFTKIAALSEADFDLNRVRFAGVVAEDCVDGQVRFLSGPQTGVVFTVLSANGDWLALDRPLSEDVEIGTRAEVREGCDHTLRTCSTRFGNAINFRGEPFLPGNDLLARYGQSGN